MIVCPNCRHKEISGAIFCSECGALLEGVSGVSTQSIQTASTDQLVQQYEEIKAAPEMVTLQEAGVSLCLVDNGQTLPLKDRAEFTLGRSAEGQPILPDIDLGPYKAYEQGVSRLHVSIKFTGSFITATDLGSINGTRINGQRIPPHKPCPLSHGDILTLGKMKLQVLVNR